MWNVESEVQQKKRNGEKTAARNPGTSTPQAESSVRKKSEWKRKQQTPQMKKEGERVRSVQHTRSEDQRGGEKVRGYFLQLQTTSRYL